MKSSSKAILWVLLVFLVGAGFGGTATFLVIRARLGNMGVLPQQQTRGQFLRQMLSQLDLDADQEAAVRAIIQDTRSSIQRIEHEKNKNLRLERRQALAKIRQLLNPEQQRKLDVFLRDRSLRRHNRREN